MKYIFLLFILFFASNGAVGKPMSVAVYEDHEQYIEHARPYKLNWLLLERAANKQNIQLEKQQLTWVRALKLLEKKQLDAVIGAYYTDNRARFAHFSTPFSIDNVYLYAKEPTIISIAEINQRGLVVGFTTSSIGESVALAKGIESIYRKSASQEVFNLLQRGRIHFAIFSESVARTHCGKSNKKLGRDNCISAVLPRISTGANHTMYSKAAATLQLAEQIESALEALINSGEALELYRSVGYSQLQYNQWLQLRQQWQGRLSNL